MFSWFHKQAEPLKPLPLSQREKSYSSAGGCVFQYKFKGMAGKRHVFEVSADRGAPFEVRIELTAEALGPCADRMASELRWNEEYALVKLCLFEAFDKAENPHQLLEVIYPTSAQLLEHMNVLKMA